MAKKKLEEPEKWITVNGQHLPVYPGGVIGQPGQTPPAKKSSAENTKKPKTNREWFDHLKKTGEIDKDAEYEDFISYAPITDKEAERIVKRGKQMELADEADAYDRAHGEGRYAKTTSRSADDIYNERKNIKGNTQEEATKREKLSEELSRTVVSGMKSGEVYKVPSGKGYEELRYVGSEMKNNRAYATFETPNKSRTGIVKEGSDLYGIQSMKSSKPTTTSRNAKYDTSRSNKKVSAREVRPKNHVDQNVSDVLEALGWTREKGNRPMFIDKMTHGYRVRMGTDSKATATKRANLIKQKTGIDVIVRQRGGDDGYDMIIPFFKGGKK